MNKIIYLYALFVFIIIAIDLHAEKLKPHSNNYYIITDDKVNIRDAPSTSSKIICQLNITHEVILIKRSGKKEIIKGSKREWVFVDTRIANKGLTDTLKGWLFDQFIINVDDFKPMKCYLDCTFTFNIGDAGFSYKIFKDATYIREDVGFNNQLVKIKGKLYQYGNVIIAHDTEIIGRGSVKIDTILYINNKGLLCHKFGEKIKGPCCAEYK
jgi:hypothetical protein